MVETLFPERQRCKTCRGSFKSHVLNGLYCSYKCAKHPLPTTDAAKAPRECAYPRDGSAVFKRKFRCESEIPNTIMSKPDVSVYRCSHCLYLHTGTAVARTVKASKSVGTWSELAEVLTKARGGADRKVVAKAAGILPIRIKELEDGTAKVDPDALFALLRVYRLSLSVGFR